MTSCGAATSHRQGFDGSLNFQYERDQSGRDAADVHPTGEDCLRAVHTHIATPRRPPASPAMQLLSSCQLYQGHVHGSGVRGKLTQAAVASFLVLLAHVSSRPAHKSGNVRVSRLMLLKIAQFLNALHAALFALISLLSCCCTAGCKTGTSAFGWCKAALEQRSFWRLWQCVYGNVSNAHRRYRSTYIGLQLSQHIDSNISSTGSFLFGAG